MVLSNNLYYFGISYAVPRNSLAKANEKRDWHIYKDFAEVLLNLNRSLENDKKLFLMTDLG